MRSAIIAAAAACLVLAGCSSEGSSGSDGKAGSSGTAGSNGAAGAAGQNGAAGAQGPIGPAGPKGDKGDPGSAGASATSSKNGTRIKVLRTSETTADGMEVVSVGGYVDTARGDERCIAFPSGDGTLRCVPTVYPQAVAGSIVWDNTCTTPLVLTTAIPRLPRPCATRASAAAARAAIEAPMTRSTRARSRRPTSRRSPARTRRCSSASPVAASEHPRERARFEPSATGRSHWPTGRAKACFGVL